MILRQDQALAIVNTRKHVRELFARIRREDGARHLSTMMCAAHRSEALDAIRQELANGWPARAISTSQIDAGVDISFPLVLPAEAGLERIAQAAGRVASPLADDIRFGAYLDAALRRAWCEWAALKAAR